MMAAIPIDLITGLLSFLFTLMIFSYIVGDNPVFRLAVYAFIGVSTAYITAIVFRYIIADKLILPLLTGTLSDRIVLAIPAILALLLLTKASPSLEWMGRPVVALIVGVGAAIAITGAVMGTLLPQVNATINAFSLAHTSDNLSAVEKFGGAATVLVATVFTLAYFQFTIRGKNAASGNRGLLMRIVSLIGQIFIAITLGVIFAGVLSAALTALADRMLSIVNFLDSLLSPFLF